MFAGVGARAAANLGNVGYLNPRIRLVENELPDSIPDGPLGEAEATATAG